MVTNENKPREMINFVNENNNNSYNGERKKILQFNEAYRIVNSGDDYAYSRLTMDISKQNNFSRDFNYDAVDKLNCSNNYNLSINRIDSLYSLSNTHPVDNTYNQQSSNINNDIDADHCNSCWYNSNNNGYDISFPRHLTEEKNTTNVTQSPIDCSNSTLMKTLSQHNDRKRTKLKDLNKRESHNRIERRRREFINKRIMDLGKLLPLQMLTDGESNKNKGQILQKSVMYIQCLQNETMNTCNYVKEAELASMLVDGYRRQIQNIQRQIQSVEGPTGLSAPPCRTNIADNYDEYLLLRAQNRQTKQLRSTGDRLPPRPLNKLSIPSSSSPLASGFAFKFEPSSAKSSVSNTNWTDEETGAGFNSSNTQFPVVIKPVNYNS